VTRAWEDFEPAPGARQDLAHAEAARMRERQLHAAVLAIVAELGGIRVHYDGDMRRSRLADPGFPDLVLLGPGGILYRELKRQDERPSHVQSGWGQALLDAGCNWAIWRPLDLLTGQIRTELSALTIPHANAMRHTAGAT
jgi:hypothetical protein